MTLKGTNTRKRIRQTLNNMVNLIPNSGTFASTDHANVVYLLGR